MTASGGDVTRLLAELREGDREAPAPVYRARQRPVSARPAPNRAQLFAIAADTIRLPFRDCALPQREVPPTRSA